MTGPRRVLTVQVAAAALGAVVLVLALIGTVSPTGAGSVLPPAAPMVAGYWALGAVLVVATAGSGRVCRILVATVGVMFLAAGVTGLAAGAWLGEVFGLAGPMPWRAALLHLVIGALAVAAAFLPVPSCS